MMSATRPLLRRITHLVPQYGGVFIREGIFRMDKQFAYLVSTNNGIELVKRKVSAMSRLDAAGIYLGQEASPRPRGPQEADRPACYVEVLGASQQMPSSSIPFWLAR
jgi:hypothetical protein